MKYLKNVAQLQLNKQKCTGCRICITVCPHEVFRPDGRKVEIADKDLCMECGACQKNCPEGALKVRAGVGCAAAVISGKLKGTAPECGCSETRNCC